MRLEVRTALGWAVAVAALGGCASANPAGAPDETGITREELAAGATFSGEEVEPDDEAPADDPAPAGDPNADGGTGDGTAVAALTGGCRNTTGYRGGSAFTICTTTVDGKPVEASTADAYHRMQSAAAAAGVSIRIVSGFRTMAEQRALYSAYKSGRGNLAAPPGFSNHQSGHALDLNYRGAGVQRWLTSNAATFGFRRTVPSEKWHWEH